MEAWGPTSQLQSGAANTSFWHEQWPWGEGERMVGDSGHD